MQKHPKDSTDQLLVNVNPGFNQKDRNLNISRIATRYAEASILFADIVNFTGLSERIGLTELVTLLHDVFSSFDKLVDEYALTKIKTIGDAYMVAGGVPMPRPDHAEAAVDLGIDMLNVLRQYRLGNGQSLSARIGINTGPVVAGIIGQKKSIFDLWGSAVSLAKRMESHGVEGAIQVTEEMYQRLKYRYRFRKRGRIDVKGNGQIVTYVLVGDKGREG